MRKKGKNLNEKMKLCFMYKTFLLIIRIHNLKFFECYDHNFNHIYIHTHTHTHTQQTCISAFLLSLL